MLQSLLASSSDMHQTGLRILLVAASLLLFESFIIVGPFKGLIARTFLGADEARLNPKKARRLVSQLAARLVGATFLAVMFPLAFKTLQDSSLQADKLYARSNVSTRCLDIAAGYFLYDIFICTVRFHENGPAFLIHALGCGAVFNYAALNGVLHYYGAAFLMWELSTPFVYVRWVLLKLGQANSKLFALNQLAGFLVFLLCRNLYGPYMSWDFVKASTADLASPRPGSFQPATIYAFWAVCVALNGLNYFWMAGMVRLALGASHPKHTKEAKQS